MRKLDLVKTTLFEWEHEPERLMVQYYRDESSGKITTRSFGEEWCEVKGYYSNSNAWDTAEIFVFIRKGSFPIPDASEFDTVEQAEESVIAALPSDIDRSDQSEDAEIVDD